MRDLQTRDPATVRQPDAVYHAAQNLIEREGRKPWRTGLREAANVSDTVPDHRHRIGVKFRDQDGGFRFVGLWFDQGVGPIDVVVKRNPGFDLEAHNTGVPCSVTLVYWSAESFLN